MTRLDLFIKQASVKPSRLAERAGVSRQHLLRLRRGEIEPTRRMMVALANAASQMCCRAVYTVELFELSPGDESRRSQPL